MAALLDSHNGLAGPNPPPRMPLPESRLILERIKNYVPLKQFRSISASRKQGKCELTDYVAIVVDPETRAERSMIVTEFRPSRQVQPLPATIVIPTIDGVTVLEYILGYQLCLDDFIAYVPQVSSPVVPDQMPSSGLEDENNRLAVASVRALVTEIQKRDWVHPEKISLIGNSLGGILGSLIAAAEDRIKAFVITGAAGNLPYVMSQSRARLMRELRTRRMTYLGLTSPDDYENWLRQRVLIDPLHVAQFVDREKILMFRVTNDDHVPTSEQIRLWFALGGPVAIDFNSGHVGSIVGVSLFYYYLMADFIRARM